MENKTEKYIVITNDLVREEIPFTVVTTEEWDNFEFRSTKKISFEVGGHTFELKGSNELSYTFETEELSYYELLYFLIPLKSSGAVLFKQKSLHDEEYGYVHLLEKDHIMFDCNEEGESEWEVTKWEERRKEWEAEEHTF